LQAFAPDTQLTLQINHSNGQSEQIKVNHTYNASQIDWFRAGSALNLIKMMEA
jgi:aconitate hydratase